MSVKILYLINLLDAIGMALVLPLINPHVLSLGGSLSSAGILNSLSAGAQLFASPVVGSWSDTRGRKLLLLSTLVTVFISNILAGVSSLGFFFISRVLYGIAHQTDPLLRTIIADKVPKEEQTSTFNNLMSIGAIAFIIGPVAGGILYETFQSFTYISIILCSLDIITISVTLLYVEEPKKIQNDSENHNKQTQNTSFLQSIYADLSKVFSDLKNVDWSRYGNLLAIKFLLEAGFSLLFINFGFVLMQKFLFTQTQMGVSIAYLSIVMILSTFFSMFIIKTIYKSDRSGFHRMMHSFILLSASYVMLVTANTPVFYLSLLIPISIGKILADTTWMEILTLKVIEKDKGVMMGAATSMLSLSGLVCPLIGGFAGDFIGIFVVTTLPIIPSVFGIYLVNKLKHHDTFTVETVSNEDKTK